MPGELPLHSHQNAGSHLAKVFLLCKETYPHPFVHKIYIEDVWNITSVSDIGNTIAVTGSISKLNRLRQGDLDKATHDRHGEMNFARHVRIGPYIRSARRVHFCTAHQNLPAKQALAVASGVHCLMCIVLS